MSMPDPPTPIPENQKLEPPGEGQHGWQGGDGAAQSDATPGNDDLDAPEAD